MTEGLTLDGTRSRRRIMRKLQISELSAVDVPAQTPATAALMKRAASDAAELTQDGVRAGIDGLRRELSGADPEVAEGVLRRLCEANARKGEGWEQTFARLLRDGDPLVEAITLAHDAAFRARASRGAPPISY